MKLGFAMSAMAFGLVCGAQTPPAQPTQPPVTGQPAPDTKSNDRDMTQKIRKAIMDDSTLSTSAHNVKINTKDGKVTLKGPVTSDDEKRNIEKKATDIAGSGKVTDDLTVKAARAKKGS